MTKSTNVVLAATDRRLLIVATGFGGEQPDYISSDCQLAGHHIEQGIAESGFKHTTMAHPLTLLRTAYGI